MTDCMKFSGWIQSTRKTRNSNLELFRILTMLSIVAHHYVVNSGLLAADGVVSSNPTTIHSLVLLLVGAWGKIGINSFGLYLLHSPLIYITFTYLLNSSPIVVSLLNFFVFGGLAYLMTVLIRKTPMKLLIGG